MCSFAVLLWEEPGKTAAFFIILMIMCGLFASVSSPFVALFATLREIPLTLWILVAAVWIHLRWELPNNIFRYILNDML